MHISINNMKIAVISKDEGEIGRGEKESNQSVEQLY